jgi:hypothetical protein
MLRARVIMMAAMAAVLLMALPALAQYPPESEGATVTVGQTTVQAGGTIPVTGDGFLPGSSVAISLHCPGRDAVPLGTATVNADGEFSTEVTIPADTPPGECILRVAGVDADGETVVLDTLITVTAAATAGPGAPAAPAASGGLARTGGLLTPGAALAALFLVVGGGAVFASRRLNRTPA